MSMSKGRLCVLLVFTLVLVSTQCAVFCTVEPCNGGGIASTPSPAGDPPCHHHGTPAQQTPAPPCSHHIVVQADVAPPLVTPDLTSNVLAMDVPALSVGAFPALSDVDRWASHALSPPGLTVPSSAVLRI
jgi:hypothetical protein